MPAYRPRGRRFTIYDMMEEKGVFAANAANADSQTDTGEPLYAGPVEYPKMLYHPQGALFVAVPANPEVTPFGPKMLNEQKRLITRVVGTREEELEALTDGWHLHPAHAHKARADWEVANPPAATYSSSDAETMAETIRQLQRQMLDMALRQQPAPAPATGLSEVERKELEELRALRAMASGAVQKSSVDLAPDEDE